MILKILIFVTYTLMFAAQLQAQESFEGGQVDRGDRLERRYDTGDKGSQPTGRKMAADSADTKLCGPDSVRLYSTSPTATSGPLLLSKY
jgi:hypothetical protein